MVLLSQSGKVLMDWATVTRIAMSHNEKGNAILAIQGGAAAVGSVTTASNSVMGTYRTGEHCLRVIVQLYDAIVSGRPGFEFPQPEELPVSKAHYGSGGGRRHGGS